MLAPLTPPVAVWATSKATDTGCAIPTSEARDSVSLRGVVKAGCKVTISARLKRDGMHWTVTGANAIIALRCCRLRRGSRPGRPFSDRLLIGFRSGSLRSRRIGKNTDRTLSFPGTRTPSRGEGPASGIQGGWPGDSYGLKDVRCPPASGVRKEFPVGSSRGTSGRLSLPRFLSMVFVVDILPCSLCSPRKRMERSSGKIEEKRRGSRPPRAGEGIRTTAGRQQAGRNPLFHRDALHWQRGAGSFPRIRRGRVRPALPLPSYRNSFSQNPEPGFQTGRAHSSGRSRTATSPTSIAWRSSGPAPSSSGTGRTARRARKVRRAVPER